MYRVDQKKSGKFKLLGIASLIILLISSLVYALAIGTNNSPSSPASFNPAKTPAKPVEPVGLDSKMLFVGDVFWGRYINDWSMASPQKMAYPFSKLSQFERDSYDGWIGNLECPSIKEAKPYSSAQQDALLSFNCDPAYLPETKKWFNAFSLANNHTDNRGGRAGLEETRTNLENNGIQYFGDYDPENYDNVCEVIAMPARIKMSDDSTRKVKLPIAFCGYHGVFKIPSAKSLALMKDYSKYMPVFAVPHAGVEYKSAPDALKTKLYRAMIDNGADAVFGGHPHWVQPAEVYKNKLIVHSMGNFIFDQQYNAEVTRSANIQLELSLAENPDLQNLQKWLDLAEKCAAFKDNCLADAKAQNLTKLPLSFNYGVIAGDSAGKITNLGSKEILTSVKSRLGWTSVVKQLKPPYSAQP